MIGLIGPLGPFELLASLAFMLAFAAGGAVAGGPDRARGVARRRGEVT